MSRGKNDAASLSALWNHEWTRIHTNNTGLKIRVHSCLFVVPFLFLCFHLFQRFERPTCRR